MKNKPNPIRNALLFFMKITLIHMLITSVTVMMGYAVDSSGQEVLERKLTLQAENADVKTVLAEIEKKADVRFTYRPRLIRDLENVSLDVKEAPLYDVLAKVFGSSLGYEVIGKQIVLKAVPAGETEDDDDAPVVTPNFAVNIVGRIVDEAAQPIPGVNVLVKGTTNGTTSDADGRYALSVVDQNSFLVFSFIGYTTQEIEVGNKTTIDVTDLIWKGARMAGFSLFAQSPTAIATAWRDVIPLIVGGSVKPIVERVYPLGEAGEALRHLIEDRPFGKVVLAG